MSDWCIEGINYADTIQYLLFYFEIRSKISLFEVRFCGTKSKRSFISSFEQIFIYLYVLATIIPSFILLLVKMPGGGTHPKRKSAAYTAIQLENALEAVNSKCI